MSNVLLSFCLLFQTLPDAGTAHFLWRGCHGSALCHSRLLMAETPFLPYQTLKLNNGATSCSPHIFYPSYMFIETFVWCLKKVWQRIGTLRMDDCRWNKWCGHFKMCQTWIVWSSVTKLSFVDQIIMMFCTCIFTRVRLTYLVRTSITGPVQGPPSL